jgi:ubiquinone/menaquinone biosynthesis C-methylase UbiE
MLTDIKEGGVSTLDVAKSDVCIQPFANNSFDVVTMLEVLEHIPDVEAAIRSAVKMARSYVVVTVPSKEDDNPEHIHLLTKDKLTEYFSKAGVTKLSFDGVPGHLFMIAKVD